MVVWKFSRQPKKGAELVEITLELDFDWKRQILRKCGRFWLETQQNAVVILPVVGVSCVGMRVGGTGGHALQSKGFSAQRSLFVTAQPRTLAATPLRGWQLMDAAAVDAEHWVWSQPFLM